MSQHLSRLYLVFESGLLVIFYFLWAVSRSWFIFYLVSVIFLGLSITCNILLVCQKNKKACFVSFINDWEKRFNHMNIQWFRLFDNWKMSIFENIWWASYYWRVAPLSVLEGSDVGIFLWLGNWIVTMICKHPNFSYIYSTLYFIFFLFYHFWVHQHITSITSFFFFSFYFKMYIHHIEVCTKHFLSILFLFSFFFPCYSYLDLCFVLKYKR